MFLNLLTPEEKISFLEIAHHLAHSNGSVSNAESVVISGYCAEMQIANISYDDSKFDLRSTLKNIKSPQSQKIILLETMALAMADELTHFEELDKEEKSVIEAMLEEFGLSKNLAIVYAEWTKAVLSLTRQGKALIEL